MNERRAVVLGASNAVRSISTLVETARLVLGGPIDFFAAIGFGRSYGMSSSVLFRTLPGIVDCRLWDELASQPSVPTFALLTDIGNDIVYGASVEQIAAWVAECLQRLQPLSERIVVTELPVASIAALGSVRFHVFRTLLFPGARISLDQVRAATEALNARVVELAARCGARTKKPQAAWYGVDPIHVRRRCWSEAWGEILGAWRDGAESVRAPGSFARWWKLIRQRPFSRYWFGVHQQRAQPSCALADGSTIWLY